MSSRICRFHGSASINYGCSGTGGARYVASGRSGGCFVWSIGSSTGNGSEESLVASAEARTRPVINSKQRPRLRLEGNGASALSDSLHTQHGSYGRLASIRCRPGSHCRSATTHRTRRGNPRLRSVPGDGGQRSRGGRVHYLARGGAGSHLRTRMDGRRRGGIPLSATADRFHPAAGSFKDTWLCSCGGPSRPFPVPLRGCGSKGLLLRWPRQPCEPRLRHRQPSSPQTPRPTGDCAACKSLSKVEFTPKLMKFSVYSSLFEGN